MTIFIRLKHLSQDDRDIKSKTPTFIQDDRENYPMTHVPYKDPSWPQKEKLLLAGFGSIISSIPVLIQLGAFLFRFESILNNNKSKKIQLI